MVTIVHGREETLRGFAQFGSRPFMVLYRFEEAL